MLEKTQRNQSLRFDLTLPTEERPNEEHGRKQKHWKYHKNVAFLVLVYFGFFVKHIWKK